MLLAHFDEIEDALDDARQALSDAAGMNTPRDQLYATVPLRHLWLFYGATSYAMALLSTTSLVADQVTVVDRLFFKSTGESN